MALKNHFHHGVGGQGSVKLVEHVLACGLDGDGYPKVLARAAGPEFGGGAVKFWIKGQSNGFYGLNETGNLSPHDLDRKVHGKHHNS